jgi:hypothetical protein
MACMASLKRMEKIAQLDPSCSSLGMLLGSFLMVVEEVIVVMVGAGGAVAGVGPAVGVGLVVGADVGAGVDAEAEAGMFEPGPIT